MLRGVFNALDKSGDGFVSTSELDEAIESDAVLLEIKKLGLKRHHLETMFASSDNDGDGQINVVEFMQGFSDLLNIPLDRKDIVELAAAKIHASEEKPRWGWGGTLKVAPPGFRFSRVRVFRFRV